MVCLLTGIQACGDDEPAADGGTDASADGGRGGRGGNGGSSGRSGNGGSGGRSGAGASDAGGDELQTVTIRWKAKLGSEDLRCGREYADQGKTKVRATPQDFRFFVEQVNLITASGDSERVQFDERAPFQTKDVALIDFTDRQGMCSVGGATVNTTITGKVRRGAYTAIEFVNGVPETLNHQNIAVATPPLQDTSTYWGWASGYRFIMTSLAILDAPAPSDADGGAPTGPRGSSVHIGSAGCAPASGTGFSCSRPNRTRVRLDGFDPAENIVVADLSEVFAEMDLTQAVECHSPGPDCGPAYAAFGVDLDSGDILGDQQVFRVE